MKTTRYFEEQVLRKRPYLQREWCERALRHSRYPLTGCLAFSPSIARCRVLSPLDQGSLEGISIPNHLPDIQTSMTKRKVTRVTSSREH